MKWKLLILIVAMIGWVSYFHPDWIVTPPYDKVLALADDKITPNLPDPNRPYFDLWGNEFTYNGTLLKAAPCVTDPISGQQNPISCPMPIAQTAPLTAINFEGK